VPLAAPDGDAVQCHICGYWCALLGAHANASHGLRADAYRRAFGLRKTTALASANYREKRRRISAQLVTPERLEATRAAAEALSPNEMRRRSWMKRRRRQHDLETWTEPTRTRAALTALYGTAEGYPTEILEGFAEEFVAELQNGQKGVYARLGDRWGVKWPSARSRVMAAVRRGALVWTGGDHTPNGYLPGEQPSAPLPGSFEQRLGLLHQWVDEYGSSHVSCRTVYEGAQLRSWMNSQRSRYQDGTLTQEQIDTLEAVPGWWWQSAAPRGTPGN
jgi:hypothetical protein